MTGSDAGLARRSVAIGLLAAGVLLYEIGVTRVLSVVVGYHFAFLSISLAMLGLGAPGVWFARVPPSERTLRRVLVAAGAVVPLSIAVLFWAGRFLPRMEATAPALSGLLQPGVVLAILCVLSALLALGAAVCVLLVRADAPEIARLYGSDLLGAALGATAVVPLMTVIQTPSLLAATGFLPLAAAAILCRPAPRAAWGLALALAVALAWGTPFRLTWTKHYVEQDVLFERWTPTARITVFPNAFWRGDPSRAFGWGMGSRWTPSPAEELWIEQDGSAGTPIVRSDGAPRTLGHVLYDVTTVGYQLRPARRALILGSGGGKDIVAAKRTGSVEVDAVELNGAIVEAVAERFRSASGSVYQLPGVRAHVAEGRSFVTRAEAPYDSIQISLIDSWAATSAGAYALAENYLYTVEALRLYLSRLTPGGMLSISRWVAGLPRMESPRLAAMAVRALEEEGFADAHAHVAVVQGDKVATLLVSRGPWRPDEIERIDRICSERGFVRHWPISPATPRDSVVALALTSGVAPIEEHGYDLSPSTDDRPFFFQSLRVFGRVDPRVLERLSVNEHSVLLLRRLLVVVGSLAAALFFVPSLFWRAAPRGPGFVLGTAFFAAIGAAYMLVQAPWVQRFVLHLGHPAYATPAVLGAMLVGTGLGSLAAGRVGLARSRVALVAIPFVLATTNLALAPVFEATAGSSLGTRVAVAVLAVVPSGLVMGFAFPAGIARFGQARMAWFWAVNGFAGVLASVASLALAMAFGLRAVVWIACALYGLAAAFVAIPAAAKRRQA